MLEISLKAHQISDFCFCFRVKSDQLKRHRTHKRYVGPVRAPYASRAQLFSGRPPPRPPHPPPNHSGPPFRPPPRPHSLLFTKSKLRPFVHHNTGHIHPRHPPDAARVYCALFLLSSDSEQWCHKRIDLFEYFNRNVLIVLFSIR